LNNITFAIIGAAVSLTFFKSVPKSTCTPLICDQTFEYFVSGDLEKELNCL
jgi:hypothetical protein